jgi:hypothetical protein
MINISKQKSSIEEIGLCYMTLGIKIINEIFKQGGWYHMN